MKVIAIVLFLTTMALSAAGQRQNPPQYSKPAGEPVPQSSTLENAPPAPAVRADWATKLTERHEAIVSDHLRVHVFRLRPGDDLLGSVRAYVNANHMQAAVLLSAVGSLTQASIRYANQPEAHVHTGHFEIVSITETVEEGGEHRGQGNMIGGHLMTGCKIYTTGEITLGEIEGVRFHARNRARWQRLGRVEGLPREALSSPRDEPWDDPLNGARTPIIRCIDAPSRLCYVPV